MSLRLQLDYGAARAKDELAEVLANIKPMEVALFKVVFFRLKQKVKQRPRWFAQ